MATVTGTVRGTATRTATGAVTGAVRGWGAAALVAALLIIAAFALGRDTVSEPAAAVGVPGAIDVGFSQDMAAHHDQAVLMANLAISRGGPAVRGIADSILTAQSQEIGQLRGWLQLWNEPLADLRPMHWMPDAMAHAGTMPGMATPSQLSTLYGLTGKRFDVLFLQLMIRHHQGGIAMAHYAESHASLATVRSAATAMRVEQVQDLTELIPLLRADGGRELPVP